MSAAELDGQAAVDDAPPHRDFLSTAVRDTRQLVDLLRLWREWRLGAAADQSPALGPRVAQEAIDKIDALRAQLHAAQLQLGDELREHQEAIARAVDQLRRRPDATRGRPAALRREHQEAPD